MGMTSEELRCFFGHGNLYSPCCEVNRVGDSHRGFWRMARKTKKGERIEQDIGAEENLEEPA